MSELLAGVGVLAAAGAARRGDPAAAGPGPRRRRCCGARPLPGPDPRRPVALPPDRRPARRRGPLRRPRRRWPLAASAALAAVFRRWPILLPLAIVAALPFRVPLEAGGDTANLLVPLYLVIAGGVCSLPSWRQRLRGLASGRPRADAGAPQAPCPRRPRRPTLVWLPRSWPRSCFSTPCRRCTRRTSRNRCRTSASSSCPSRWSSRCCATSSGTGGCWSCVLWVVAVEAVAFVAGRARSST